jgi:hypothetical protein
LSDNNIVLKQLSDDENATLNALLGQLAQKAPRNLLRASYYDGKRAIKQVGTVIPPQYAKLGLALGWAAKGVDGLARRTHLEKMVWTAGDIDALGMAELADSNFLFSEVAAGLKDSLIHGVSYLITTAGEVSAGEPKALVHAKDGMNATGDWNNRTRKLDNLLSITSRHENDVTGFILYLNNLTISAEKDSSGWTVDRQTHSFGVPADPLVYQPRSSRRMGKSRITRPLMGYQDAALRALVRLEAHMDIYTIPKLILLGADESIFKNPDGSPKAAWQIALARTFGLPDSVDGDQDNQRADVKQIDATSPDSHLSDLNALAKLSARETDLPDADFALTDMANPTSEGSYIAGRDNLIAEAEGATEEWSVSIRRSVSRALAIQNGLSAVPAAWASIDTKFRSPLYLSKAAAADAGSKQIGAVPWLAETEVGLELLGLDAQQVKRAMADKRRAQSGSLVESLRVNAASAVTNPAVAAVAAARTGE